jgi:tight adherence protein C
VFDLDPQLAAALIGAGVAIAIWAVASQAHDKATVRESLRALEDYEVESVRDQELLNPLAQRALLPVLGALTNLGRRFTPVGYVDNVRHKFVLSGRPSADTIDRFLAIRVVTVCLVPVSFWLFYIWNPLGLQGITQMGVTLLAALVLVVGPDAQLNRAVEARQKEILKGLPDIIDLLVISVEAGLGFEAAMGRVVQNVPGELAREFSRTLQETRVGVSRNIALRNLAGRTDVDDLNTFILSLIQADQFGVSIARMLRVQADEMRVRRRQRAQERAFAAPVKLVFPLVLCIFPSIFVVILGPAVINIMSSSVF